MSTTIRPVTFDDFDALRALMDEIHRLHVEGLPRIFRMPATPVIPREVIEEQLTSPEVLLIAAFDAGQMVGFLRCEIRVIPERHTHRGRHTAEIDTLVVAQTHQGRGIGRALMHAAEEWGREQGASEAILTVWQFNDGAIDFYERLGYEAELIRMSKRL